MVAGNRVQFSVEAFGKEPLAYQWRADGKEIPGATQALFELTDVASGECEITIAGPPGVKVLLQASADLVQWESLGVLANPTGTLGVLDSASIGERECFYRVLAPSR